MEARTDIDAQIVRDTELLEAKNKSNHPVAGSFRQFPSHTTQHHTHNNTRREDIIRETQENKGREKRENICFHVFFACDGGGSVDLPQHVQFFCFSMQLQALFNRLT